MFDIVESGKCGIVSGVIILLEWVGNFFFFGLVGYLIVKVVDMIGESEGIKVFI